MDNKEMENRIKELEKQVAKLKDLEDINRLQKSYGYYLEHWMYEDVIDLFADGPDTTLNIMAGIYRGKEGVRRYFTGVFSLGKNPEFLHQIMQLAGVVDIDEAGKTARGRWYGFGSVALPRGEGVTQFFTDGIYTSEYIKKDGKWQILKLMWNPLYTAAPEKGWVAPERIEAAKQGKKSIFTNSPKPDEPRDIDARYPSGYIVPFHYKHPVTGKPSTDTQRNASLK
ncbi:MAG TPA: nuclear transport factor 2 family protein, partial [Dehalococcoidales bacterium]|nr:nuclear transport factor 2 family protein [Dehalococcoidales bacterium]